ncbi:hypothetical protein GCM10022243_67730 [Saccharothrix violaceirubra]|uniref:CHAT domain-containing protein n=1 Tax=Saccharothrix violaceirubra TaxID=413306 RepID=A0A7W7T3D7_9PSEU|nr:hypothetical protein [Saccharothrix violaceirubra]MBB4965277.1 hypothetical protein [Saccharothrix violaceirubra]
MGDLDTALALARAEFHSSTDRWHLVAGPLVRLLRLRYEYLGGPADLDEAVTLGITVDVAGLADVSTAEELSRALVLRGSYYEDAADIGTAVDLARRALRTTVSVDVEDSRVPVLCTAVADALLAAYELSDDQAHLDQALESIEYAASSSDAAVVVGTYGRIVRARSDDLSGIEEAIRLTARAVVITPPGTPQAAVYQADLAEAVLDRADLTDSDADVDQAIGLLRPLVGSLPESSPVRWRCLHLLRAELVARGEDAPAEDRPVRWGERLPAALALAEAAWQPHLALAAWRAVLVLDPAADVAAHAAARLLDLDPDLARFAVELLQRASTPDGPEFSFTDLAPAAHGGPVVLVNIDDLRCDALVVIDGGVVVVPLPGLTAADARAAAHALVEAEDRRERLPDLLRWLWNAIAAPVFDVFRFVGGQEPPRLWWCLAGPYRFLPVHAAGDGENSVMDLVVSSYTRDPAALLVPERPRCAPIALVDTDDHPVPTREVYAPTASPAGIGTATWLHLAAPSVTFDLAALSVPTIDFAYFSAHAAAPVHEGNDLPATFHGGGRLHVVAQRWPAPDVTADLYRELAFDSERTARALHRVLTARRAAHPADWAGYVHYGP